MREIISLNENWTLSFPKGERPTEQVTLPHTWNAVDGMDGNGSYLRTTGVYTRTFTQPKQPLAGGRTYVEVLAAALAATVKVNGQVATTHEGGFSIFRADVTDLCHEGDNEQRKAKCRGAMGEESLEHGTPREGATPRWSRGLQCGSARRGNGGRIVLQCSF